MISSKHCDVCDVELPPMCFHNTWECADTSLHEKHPSKTFSWIRVTVKPIFTNGPSVETPDVCPDCFVKMTEALVARLKRNIARARKTMDEWKHWRVRSRKEEVREGSNGPKKPTDKKKGADAK